MRSEAPDASTSCTTLLPPVAGNEPGRRLLGHGAN
jgi:hypothetical protein